MNTNNQNTNNVFRLRSLTSEGEKSYKVRINSTRMNTGPKMTTDVVNDNQSSVVIPSMQFAIFNPSTGEYGQELSVEEGLPLELDSGETKTIEDILMENSQFPGGEPENGMTYTIRFTFSIEIDEETHNDGLIITSGTYSSEFQMAA